MADTKVQHITSGVISHEGVPHFHAICVAVGKRSTHPITMLVGPYGKLDIPAHLDAYAELVDAYDAINPSFEARIGETLTPCHASVVISDLRIQLHGLKSMNVVLAAAGTLDTEPISVIERWPATELGALPSPQACIDMVVQKLTAHCKGTHHFDAMLTAARAVTA
jgi:hypothetical protein